MAKAFGWLMVFLLVAAALSGLWRLLVFIAPVVLGLLLLIVGLWAIVTFAQWVWRRLSPEADKRHKIEMQAKEATQRNVAAAEQMAKAKLAQANAEREDRLKAEAAAREKQEYDEERMLFAANLKLRDADQQSAPYAYRVGDRTNRELAIRYGVANDGKSPGSPTTPREHQEQLLHLRKLKRIGNDKYLAALSDFGDREVRVEIAHRSGEVSSFLPKNDEWLSRFAELENTLLGNRQWTLSQLAQWHIDKTV